MTAKKIMRNKTLTAILLNPLSLKVSALTRSLLPSCKGADGLPAVLSGEPVFVTKNGYGRLVVMDIDYYNRTMHKIDEAGLVNKGIAEYKQGKVVDGRSSIQNLRKKHGI
jgi:hypothetical protein